MTDTQTTNLLPIGVREAPEGTYACRFCGLPVTGGTIYQHRIFARIGPSGIQDVGPNVTMFAELSECEHCSALRAQAEHVIQTHQGLRKRFGSLAILSERFMHALVAIDALGLSQPVWTYESIVSALHWLESAGATMTFSARYSPVRDIDARDGQAATEPYLFASIESREEAKAGYLQTLVDARGPRPIPCPSGACASCGVASFNARRPGEAWVEAPAKYPGRHLCRTCENARGEGGVMGIGMLERAVLDVADPDKSLRHRRFDQPSVQGATFFVDSGRTKPNERPFQHLDIEGLRRSIAGSAW